MTKRRKHLESNPYRIYVSVMRRLFLNNMALLVALSCLVSTAGAASGTQPTFIILSPSADINVETSVLESQGAQVRASVPPQILIADLPTGISLSGAVVLKRYVSAVPIKDLSSYGPVAVAAGINWNRNFVSASGSASLSSMGASAVRAMVAQESLPAPQGVTANVNANGFRVEWPAVPAALYYQIQVSKSADFSSVFYETRSGRLSVDFPRPESAALSSFYIRVRGADRPDTANAAADLFGRWSTPVQATVTGAVADGSRPAPTLTSPVDSLTSTGFTLLLEWTGEPARTYRLQVSRSASFSTTLIDELVPFETFAVPSAAMHVGETFFWRVRESSDRLSAWSDSRRFTVGEPHHALNDVFVNPEAPK